MIIETLSCSKCGAETETKVFMWRGRTFALCEACLDDLGKADSNSTLEEKADGFRVYIREYLAFPPIGRMYMDNHGIDFISKNSELRVAHRILEDEGFNLFKLGETDGMLVRLKAV